MPAEEMMMIILHARHDAIEIGLDNVVRACKELKLLSLGRKEPLPIHPADLALLGDDEVIHAQHDPLAAVREYLSFCRGNDALAPVDERLEKARLACPRRHPEVLLEHLPRDRTLDFISSKRQHENHASPVR
jgi:hypothetical protein